MSSRNQSIMGEIAAAEEAIKTTYERIEKLETKLREEDLPENKRDMLRRELEEFRKLLATHEEQLSHLRTHNRHTFVFIVLLIFVCFSMYTIYVLVRGNPIEKLMDF